MWKDYFGKGSRSPKYETIPRTSNESNSHCNTSAEFDASHTLHGETTTAQRPRSFWKRHGRSICEGLVLSIGIGAAWAISHPPSMSLHDERNPTDGLTFTSGQFTFVQHLSHRPCGNNPETAVANGCDFDHVTTSWLPPRCIDYELQEDFLTSIKPGGWKFWADDQQEEEYDAEKIGFVHDEIWASNEWHMWHCLYVWRKLARTIRAGRSLDGSTLSLTHTDHCAHMTGAEYATTQSEIRTLVSINYPPC